MTARSILGAIISHTQCPDLADLIQQLGSDIDILFVRDRTASDDTLQKAARLTAENKSPATNLIVHSPIYKDWFKKEQIDGWHLPESTQLDTCHPGGGRDPLDLSIIQNSNKNTNRVMDPGLRRDDKLGDWGEIQNSVPFAKSFLIGRSVHSVAAAQKAEQEGMEYIIAGTIFETDSHPGKKPEGLLLLHDIRKACPVLPMLAIGGITPGNAKDCLKAGANGIIVHSGIFCAKDPAKAAQDYRQALDDYSNN